MPVIVGQLDQNVPKEVHQKRALRPEQDEMPFRKRSFEKHVKRSGDAVARSELRRHLAGSIITLCERWTDEHRLQQRVSEEGSQKVGKVE